MKIIEGMVAASPGLHLVGNAYHGIGMPDCIKMGKQVAARIAGSVTKLVSMERYRPEGFSTVTPYLVVVGADKLLTFLKAAFEAEGKDNPGSNYRREKSCMPKFASATHPSN